MENAKKKGIWAGIAALVLFIVVAVGLYLLGGDDQAPLERLRDIAIIFIVLMSLVLVVLLAAITAALAVLIIQIKDRVIPLLEDAKGGMNQVTGTAARIKNTTDFITEEAVRPIMTITGQFSRLRTMRNTVTGKNTNVRKLAKQEHITDQS
jgi:predicted PurR-regulated permease PerM